MLATARILVVADRTADSEELYAALVKRNSEQPITVTLLAPAQWEVIDPHGGLESALRRLRNASEMLSGAGIDVHTQVGDPDPVQAVAAVWDRDMFDDVIVATLPEHLSRWLGFDLPSRIERLIAAPVRHVIANERDRVPSGE
jgi:hypothetical protein